MAWTEKLRVRPWKRCPACRKRHRCGKNLCPTCHNRDYQRRRVIRPCTVCGKPNKRGGPTCAWCYQKKYRKDPVARKRQNRSNMEYAKRNPEKRKVWVQNWRYRVGWYVPDLQALRAAVKRLDRALASAEERTRLRGAG
jgi:hypothetical protein